MGSKSTENSIVAYIDCTQNNKNQFEQNGRLLPFARQLFTSSGGVILTLSSGMTNGYSAIVLPQLSNNSDISVNEEASSWIAGIVTLAMPFGGMLGGMLMDNLGRRRAQMVCCICCFAGWLCIALSPNIIILYIGRFLTGLCVGLISPIASVCIAEISEPHYRGFILAFITLAVSIGVLFVHVLGSFLYWKTTAFTITLIPTLALIFIYFSPETPTWLIRKGLLKEAETSFYWLRADKRDTESELETILKKHSNEEVDGMTVYFSKGITSFSFWKPFLITSVFFITQQFSGINAIIFYTGNILKKASPELNENTSTILIDVSRVLMSILACWLLKKCNRRTVFLISSIGSIIFLLALATFLKYPQPGIFNLLPIFFITMYVIFSTIGLVPLPWIMTGEIYPVSVRDLGNGASNCFAFLTMFTVVKTAPFFFLHLGLSGTFFLYSMITISGTIILYIYLPETNNKSLQEVEENLQCSSR